MCRAWQALTLRRSAIADPIAYRHYLQTTLIDKIRTIVIQSWRALRIQSAYGTSVIRDLIPYELGGNVDLVHASEGVLCGLDYSCSLAQ
jgi:hypothetical protein